MNIKDTGLALLGALGSVGFVIGIVLLALSACAGFTVLKLEPFEENDIGGQILYVGDVTNPRRYILTESKAWEIGDDGNWTECHPHIRKELEKAIAEWQKQIAEEAELQQIQKAVKEALQDH